MRSSTEQVRMRFFNFASENAIFYLASENASEIFYLASENAIFYLASENAILQL